MGDYKIEWDSLEDFKLDLIDAVESFYNILIESSFDEDDARSYISDWTHGIVNARTRYGAINYIISGSSALSRPLQKELFGAYVHSFLTDTYIEEIQSDAKKMLYIMNDYSVRYSNLYLHEIFSPLIEYAKNVLLLNGYKPRFNEEDLPVKKRGRKPHSLRSKDFKDILVDNMIGLESDIVMYFRQIEGLDDESRYKKAVSSFCALLDLGIINENILSFDQLNKDSNIVPDFISNKLLTNTRIDKNTFSRWRDNAGERKIAIDELKAILKIT